MKGVILAAGKGERLGELSRTTPKPMIRVHGEPILAHTIALCRAYGVTELYINTHHLPEVIRTYCGDGSRWGVKIEYSYEPVLLGTAGALRNFGSALGRDPFFVLYGDNYSRYDLQSLERIAKDRRAFAVIAFHWRDDTASSGVAEFDEDGRVLRFVEKPKPGESESRWVNAGIYYFLPGVLQEIPEGYSDFGRDIFPALLRKGLPVYGVRERSDVSAFDTPEMLKESMNRLR